MVNLSESAVVEPATPSAVQGSSSTAVPTQTSQRQSRTSTFLPSDISDQDEDEDEDEDENERHSYKKRKLLNGHSKVDGTTSSTTSTPTKLLKRKDINEKNVNGNNNNNNNNNAGYAQRKKEADRLFEKRQELPFYQGRKMILEEIMAHDTTIILGETGCGKSTQLPQLLYSHQISTSQYPSSSSGPSIAITQPRRLPAIALAQRVAVESGSSLGEQVGYSVRFEEMTSWKTRIKFMTEGVLMRELANADPQKVGSTSTPNGNNKHQEHAEQSTTDEDEDQDDETIAEEQGKGLNLLLNYDIIIIDEAHERTLNTDFLCGALKKVQKIRKDIVSVQKAKRNGKSQNTDGNGKGKERERANGYNGEDQVKELKIVVMSATLDPSKFQKFFETGRDALLVKGRMYNVSTRHVQNPVDDFIEAAARQVLGIHCKKDNEGDVLVFMPGSDEIENCVELLKRVAKQLPQNQKNLQVLPLYAALPPTAQAKIFSAPAPNSRRVIVATNIAETSLTIPGVSFVVDTGYKKEKEYIFRSSGAIEQLKKKGISKAAAWQRTGRAGRERAGECYRLFTKEAFEKMPEFDAPEIQRCNLSSAVLQLIAMAQDPLTFEYIDDPGRDAIAAAFQTLAGLSAISSPTTITPLGSEMLRYPLDPPHSRILIASFSLGCTSEIIDILSLINAGGHVFLDRPNERDEAIKMKAKFIHREGDHLTSLNVFRSYLAIKESRHHTTENGRKGKGKEENQTLLGWCKDNYVNGKTLSQALKIRNQLRDLCERYKSKSKSSLAWTKDTTTNENENGDGEITMTGENNNVMRAMLQGLFMNTAVIQFDGSYRQTAGSLTVKIHPSSVLMSKKVPAIMYDELTITTSFYARNVSAFEQHWLTEIPWFANAATGSTGAIAAAPAPRSKV